MDKPTPIWDLTPARPQPAPKSNKVAALEPTRPTPDAWTCLVLAVITAICLGGAVVFIVGAMLE